MENFIRWALRAGAIYDLVAFALLMAMPQWLFTLFEHPMPAEPFLFRLAALPLLMAPPVYFMASLEPLSNRNLVRASVLLRSVGAIGIGALILTHEPVGAGAYWAFALGDLFWAGTVVVPCMRAR